MIEWKGWRLRWLLWVTWSVSSIATSFLFSLPLQEEYELARYQVSLTHEINLKLEKYLKHIDQREQELTHLVNEKEKVLSVVVQQQKTVLDDMKATFQKIKEHNENFSRRAENMALILERKR